jgi:hypothetical protein
VEKEEPPPAAEGKLQRVLILVNPGPQGLDQEINQLTFRGPPIDRKYVLHRISNVRVVDGPAPPSGLYYNHQFSMTYKGQSGQMGGIGVPQKGPLCSKRVPANTPILKTRRLGTCTVSVRHGRFFYREVTFAVHEGFYERR